MRPRSVLLTLTQNRDQAQKCEKSTKNLAKIEGKSKKNRGKIDPKVKKIDKNSQDGLRSPKNAKKMLKLAKKCETCEKSLGCDGLRVPSSRRGEALPQKDYEGLCCSTFNTLGGDHPRALRPLRRDRRIRGNSSKYHERLIVWSLAESSAV